MSFERSRSAQRPPKKLINGGYLFQSKSTSKAAEKWGLQYFADPALNYLNAPVFYPVFRYFLHTPPLADG